LIEELGKKDSMTIDEFTLKRPFLFHLTALNNLDNIKRSKTLFSTKTIFQMAGRKDRAFLRTRRAEHDHIEVNGDSYHIRDQAPISLLALSKCLEEMNCEDYIEFLNERVFWWPTLERLERHFKRYEKENPLILKCSSAQLFDLNRNPLFSRLNSGATRANSYLGGVPPSRGRDTFLEAEKYDRGPSTVAEVTFLGKCILPEVVYLGDAPHCRWQELHLGD
jgi:hypothetical protein